MSKCVCSRQPLCEPPFLSLMKAASAIDLSVLTTLPSTAVRACARWPLRTSRTGLTSAASDSMIPSSGSGSKTSTASESEPSEAREQPSLRCTLRSSLACWSDRSERTTGLNSESKTSMQY